MDHITPPVVNPNHIKAHVNAFPWITDNWLVADAAFNQAMVEYDAAGAQNAELKEDVITHRVELSKAAAVFEWFADMLSLDALPVNTIEEVEAIGIALEKGIWNGTILVGDVPDQDDINATADELGIPRLHSVRGGHGRGLRGRGGRGRGRGGRARACGRGGG